MKAEKKKRKSLSESLLLKLNKIKPETVEEELTLHFEKDDLFDQHVVLPHMEVNPLVYQTVDRFVDRYGGESLTLNIYSGAISESAKQFFKESFVSHYEDEFRRHTTSLQRSYLRAFVLIFVSVVSYYLGVQFDAIMEGLPFLTTAIANISLFCIWEIYNTYFRRKDILVERKKTQRARDAEIRFYYRPGKKTSEKK